MARGGAEAGVEARLQRGDGRIGQRPERLAEALAEIDKSATATQQAVKKRAIRCGGAGPAP